MKGFNQWAWNYELTNPDLLPASIPFRGLFCSTNHGSQLARQGFVTDSSDASSDNLCIEYGRF